MSILLKQRHFSTFIRPEIVLRVPYKCHITLILRGVLDLELGHTKLFLGNQCGLSYKLAKSDLG